MRRWLSTCLAVASLGCGGAPSPEPAAAAGAPAGDVAGEAAVASGVDGAAPADEASAADGHLIHLHRLAVVGRRVRATVEEHERHATTVHVDGQLTKRDNKDVTRSLDATWQTVTVDDDRREQDFELLVHALHVHEADAPRLVLGGARRVRVRRAERARDATLEGVDGALSEEARSALAEVLSLGLRTSSDDEVFGTSARIRVGESWSVDRGRFVAAMRRDGVPVELGDLEARMTLVRLVEVAGHPCLEIQGHFRGQIVSMQGLGAEMRVHDGTMTFEMSGAFPVDPALPQLTSELSMRMNVDVEGVTDGKRVHLAMRVESTRKRRVEQVQNPPR